MKFASIISFLIAFTVTTVVLGIISFVLLIMTFDLAGGETLKEVEAQNVGLLVVAILCLIIAIFIASFSFKKNNKSKACGIVTLPAILFIAATVYLCDQNFRYTEFNKTTWTQSAFKPERMAKTLVKKKLLIGLTRQQVKEMLGEGYGRDASLIYDVENDWTLIIIFEDNKVIETKLRLPFLGV